MSAGSRQPLSMVRANSRAPSPSACGKSADVPKDVFPTILAVVPPVGEQPHQPVGAFLGRDNDHRAEPLIWHCSDSAPGPAGRPQERRPPWRGWTAPPPYATRDARSPRPHRAEGPAPASHAPGDLAGRARPPRVPGTAPPGTPWPSRTRDAPSPWPALLEGPVVGLGHLTSPPGQAERNELLHRLQQHDALERLSSPGSSPLRRPGLSVSVHPCW
jgi:hypothetical protein